MFPGDDLGASFWCRFRVGWACDDDLEVADHRRRAPRRVGPWVEASTRPSTRAQNASRLPCLAEGGRLAMILSDLCAQTSTTPHRRGGLAACFELSTRRIASALWRTDSFDSLVTLSRCVSLGDAPLGRQLLASPRR